MQAGDLRFRRVRLNKKRGKRGRQLEASFVGQTGWMEVMLPEVGSEAGGTQWEHMVSPNGSKDMRLSIIRDYFVYNVPEDPVERGEMIRAWVLRFHELVADPCWEAKLADPYFVQTGDTIRGWEAAAGFRPTWNGSIFSDGALKGMSYEEYIEWCRNNGEAGVVVVVVAVVVIVVVDGDDDDDGGGVYISLNPSNHV
jgi:hypothetical protein